MSTYLFVESRVAELRRRELIAESARHAALEGYPSLQQRREPGVLREWIGTAMVHIGHRLQGTQAAGSIGGKVEPITSASLS